MDGNQYSGAKPLVVVSQRMTDHSSRLSYAPRIVSVEPLVVVSQRMTDHSSRLNSQVYIRLQGIKTLLQNTNRCEKGEGMMSAKSSSHSHNRIPLRAIRMPLQRILTAILQIALSSVRVSKDISLIFADLGGHTAESVSNP